MKMYLISDNIDTMTGMRLVGVDGVIVHSQEEGEKSLEKVLEDREIGVILITEKLGKLMAEKINEVKMFYQIPLVVEIPDRHGTGRTADSITKYVREAIGLKI